MRIRSSTAATLSIFRLAMMLLIAQYTTDRVLDHASSPMNASRTAAMTENEIVDSSCAYSRGMNGIQVAHSCEGFKTVTQNVHAIPQWKDGWSLPRY